MRRIKAQATKIGGHYHVQFFCGQDGYALGGLGKLVMDVDDWTAFRTLFGDAERAGRVAVEVVSMPADQP